jgi:hypothetical protein
LEERGFDPAAAGAFLDEFLQEMQRMIALMAQLESKEDGFFTLVAPEAACPWCAPLAGKIVSAGDAGWRNCLPPLAAGCHMRCRILSADEVRALSPEEKQARLRRPEDLPLPDCGVLCPLVNP